MRIETNGEHSVTDPLSLIPSHLEDFLEYKQVNSRIEIEAIGVKYGRTQFAKFRKRKLRNCNVSYRTVRYRAVSYRNVKPNFFKLKIYNKWIRGGH